MAFLLFIFFDLIDHIWHLQKHIVHLALALWLMTWNMRRWSNSKHLLFRLLLRLRESLILRNHEFLEGWLDLDLLPDLIGFDPLWAFLEKMKRLSILGYSSNNEISEIDLMITYRIYRALTWAALPKTRIYGCLLAG